MEPIFIGSRREVLWDDFLIEAALTTCRLRLHHPQVKEIVLDHDEPWEGNMCDYPCILKDDGLYRMYYLGLDTRFDADGKVAAPSSIVVCYAESRDGRRWVKPKLGLCEHGGSRQNNIILDRTTNVFDNFSVFKDPTPGCPASERYKGIGSDATDHYLWCFTSANGIRFKKAWRMTDRGKFDTLNVAFRDPHADRYVGYIRDFHDVPDGNLNAGIRDIRRMESADFRTWSVPERLDFGVGDDVPLYTNVIQPYGRADHMLIGFPSRYVERKAWTPTFDQLPGAAARKRRMKASPRYGLTLTDCVFMSSRDGRRWRRWDDAFLTPGPERSTNWVYGDCYPALGLVETDSDLPDALRELSLYTFEHHWADRPAQLRRWTMRIDGFVSCRGDYGGSRLVTRPFVFEGSELSLNVATSAIGSVALKLIGPDRTLAAHEIFGDSLDRRVVFKEGSAAALAGRPVVLDMTLRDADLYSFRFL